MMGSTRLRRTCLALAVSATMAVSGCGLTVDSLPLPTPGQSGDTYTLHAVFDNALNLPDQAKVKIGGSNIGVVTGIETKNYQAIIDMQVRKDITLPADSSAELRKATPLGDVFIALSKPNPNQPAPDQPAPDQANGNVLHDGDTIGIEHTSAGATVEELLLSVSLLFNGGGVSALTKLASELDSVVGGRPDQLAQLIRQMTSVTTSLHANSARIDSVLNGFDALTHTIEANHQQLGQVADSLPQMIGAIAENNKKIGDLLAKISTTSAALGDYANTSHDQLAGLLDNVHKLMAALAQTKGSSGRRWTRCTRSSPRWTRRSRATLSRSPRR